MNEPVQLRLLNLAEIPTYFAAEAGPEPNGRIFLKAGADAVEYFRTYGAGFAGSQPDGLLFVFTTEPRPYRSSGEAWVPMVQDGPMLALNQAWVDAPLEAIGAWYQPAQGVLRYLGCVLFRRD